MPVIHTAQLNVGKSIPFGSNILFLDITVKSGNKDIKKYVAPTWELLTAYKAGEIDEEEYSKRYMQQLYTMDDRTLEHIRIKLSSGHYSDIVLGCYCAEGQFCHRHLFKRWLLETFGDYCEEGYEIKKENIVVHERPTGGVVSIVATPEQLKSYKSVLDGMEGMYVVNRDNAEFKDVDQGVNHSGTDGTVCHLERNIRSFMFMSILNTIACDHNCCEKDPTTVIDLTGVADELFETHDMSINISVRPKGSLGKLFNTYLNGKQPWRLLTVREGDDIVDLVNRFCYRTTVITEGLAHNEDFESRMDALYKSACTR